MPKNLDNYKTATPVTSGEPLIEPLTDEEALFKLEYLLGEETHEDAIHALQELLLNSNSLELQISIALKKIKDKDEQIERLKNQIFNSIKK